MLLTFVFTFLQPARLWCDEPVQLKEWVIPKEEASRIYGLVPPPYTPFGSTGYISYGVAVRHTEAELCFKRGEKRECFVLLHPSRADAGSQRTRHFAIRPARRDPGGDSTLFQAVVASVKAHEPSHSPWQAVSHPPPPRTEPTMGRASRTALVTAAVLFGIYIGIGLLKKRRRP